MKYDYSTIEGFNFWCQKILPLVYDESLSYYEVLCKMQSKLNEVINNQNNLNEAFNKLLEWIDSQLENYVDDKLQGWLDDGTLENLISSLGQIYHYENTTLSLLSDETLVNGMLIKTLGFSRPNDGNGATFFISNSKNNNRYCLELKNGLYAIYMNEIPYINHLTNDFTDISIIVNELISIYNMCGLKDGEYFSNNKIYIKNDTVLFGSGFLTKIYYTGNDTLLELSYPISNCIIKNIYFSNSDSNKISLNNGTCIIINPTGDNNGITNVTLENLAIWNFNIGLRISWTWGCEFSRIRINSTNKPIYSTSQVNNILYNNCHFLCMGEGTLNSLPCEFINNENIVFNECEFAEGASIISYQSELIFNGGYFENCNQPIYNAQSSISRLSMNLVHYIKPLTMINIASTLMDLFGYSNFIFSSFARKKLINMSGGFDVTNQISLENQFEFKMDYTEAYENAGYTINNGELCLRFKSGTPYITILNNLELKTEILCYVWLEKIGSIGCAIQFRNETTVLETIDFSENVNNHVISVNIPSNTDNVVLWGYKNLEDGIIKNLKISTHDFNDYEKTAIPILSSLPINGGSQIVFYNNNHYKWDGSEWVIV